MNQEFCMASNGGFFEQDKSRQAFREFCKKVPVNWSCEYSVEQAALARMIVCGQKSDPKRNRPQLERELRAIP